MKNYHYQESDINKFTKHLKNVNITQLKFDENNIFNCAKHNSGIANYSGNDFLEFTQDYSVSIHNRTISITTQIYLNITSSGNHQYRFATCPGRGMIFCINLTLNNELGMINFDTPIRFGNHTDNVLRLKKCLLKIKASGIDVFENRVFVGERFNLENETFDNTSAEKLVQDLLVISLIKAHFAGNKGVDLEFLEIENYKNYPNRCI